MSHTHRDPQPPSNLSLATNSLPAASRIPKPKHTPSIDTPCSSSKPPVAPVPSKAPCSTTTTTTLNAHPTPHHHHQQQALVDLLLDSSFKHHLTTPDKDDHDWLLGTSADVEVEGLAVDLPLSPGRITPPSPHTHHQPPTVDADQAEREPGSVAGTPAHIPVKTPTSELTSEDSEREYSPIHRLHRLWHWVRTAADHHHQQQQQREEEEGGSPLPSPSPAVPTGLGRLEPCLKDVEDDTDSLRSLRLEFSSPNSTPMTEADSLTCPISSGGDLGSSDEHSSPSPLLAQPRRLNRPRAYLTASEGVDSSTPTRVDISNNSSTVCVPALPLWRIQSCTSAVTVPNAGGRGQGLFHSARDGEEEENEGYFSDSLRDSDVYYTARSKTPQEDETDSHHDRDIEHSGLSVVFSALATSARSGPATAAAVAAAVGDSGVPGSGRSPSHRSDLPSGRSACLEHSLLGALHSDGERCEWLVAANAEDDIEARQL